MIDFAKEIQLCLEIFKDYNIKFVKPKDKIKGNFDKSNLVRIVTNLVKNSIQATSELDNPNIKIELKKIKNNVELKITDNGSGIPNSLKEKIFEPNFTTKNKGTGLGLSIIKKLIGRLWLDVMLMDMVALNNPHLSARQKVKELELLIE